MSSWVWTAAFAIVVGVAANFATSWVERLLAGYSERAARRQAEREAAIDATADRMALGILVRIEEYSVLLWAVFFIVQAMAWLAISAAAVIVVVAVDGGRWEVLVLVPTIAVLVISTTAALRSVRHFGKAAARASARRSPPPDEPSAD